MDRDERPANALQDLRDLQHDVREAKGAAGRRAALTTASKGWVLPPMATPDPPDAGAHLFVATDGDPYVIDSNGIISPLKTPPFPQAPYVAHAPNMTAGADAPATYSDVYVEALREDVRALRQTVAELIDAFRSVGLLDPTP